MVLTYDLFKDRRTIDVIITKFSLHCFKMEKRIILYVTVRKDQKPSCCIEQVRESEKKTVSFLENDLEKILKGSQSAVERD